MKSFDVRWPRRHPQFAFLSFIRAGHSLRSSSGGFLQQLVPCLARPHAAGGVRWLASVVLGCLLLAAAGVAPLRAATIFSEDFESGGLTGWLVGDNDIAGIPTYWGVVDSAFGGEGTHGGNYKAYCAATGFLGSSSAPTYQNRMTAYLLRSMDLTGYTNATLSFWYKIPSLDNPYDFAVIYVDNEEVWRRDTGRATWTQVAFSLERFVGGQHVLRFEFSSDNTTVRKGWYLDDILITDDFAPGPAPVNDNYAAALVCAGAVGSLNSSVANATFQPGEPTGGFPAVTNSAWFRWTALVDGPAAISTRGSTFDTLLCIYTGNSLTALTSVACDDNSGTNNASFIQLNAVRGTVYRIQVRGANNARGTVVLNWSQPTGLGPDRLPDIKLWADQDYGFLYGWYLDRNEPSQPGRTLLRVSTATINVGDGPLELIGSSVSPGVYQRVYRTDGSYHDRYAGTFTFHPGHGHLHLDNWLNFHLRSVLTNDGVGDIVVAGRKTSFAIIDLYTYDLTLPGAPGQGSYNGGLVQGLDVGWADVYGGNLQDQWIDVTGVPAGRYWLEALVDPAHSILEMSATNNTERILVDLTLLNAVSTPNDNFASATLLTGASTGAIGSNANATKETGEPKHYPSNAGGASVWYRWTAPADMTAVISTEGSSLDTVLAVYTGNTVATLTSIGGDGVGWNDDIQSADPRIPTSKVTFPAVGGTVYQIAVDGWNGQRGNIQLNLNPALNDALGSCITISGLAGTINGSNLGATRQAGENLHGGLNSSNSVWYCWTAPTNGPFVFTTPGSAFDTVVGIYTGSSFPLTPVASDNNGGGFGSSRVVFTAVSNTTYRIAVDSGGDAVGVFTLSWSGPRPPFIRSQPQATNLVAGSTATFTVGVDGSAPLGYQWRHFGTNVIEDEGLVSGVNSAVLTLNKILPPAAGGYSVVITNAYGAVTSAPAGLIIVDNPRVVYILDTAAPVGSVVTVPIKMQAVGDEQALKFSLAYDPAVLSNPRISQGADTPLASMTANLTATSSGRFGATLTMPAGTAIPAGSTREIALVEFNVSPTAAGGTVTPVGFADQPVTKSATSTNNAPLIALFAAGSVTLETVPVTARGERLSDGTFQLVINGIPSQNYVIEASTNLTQASWVPVSTNRAGTTGLVHYLDTQATNRGRTFYRARFAP